MYFNAFRLPDLVFNVLILGAVTTAFIPVFTDHLKKHDETEAWRLANTVINGAGLVLLASLIVLYFLIPAIIPIISPFKEAERLAQTIGLARILIIQPFFFGLSYIAGSVLNSYKRFVSYSIAPLIYNLSIIVGIVYLSPNFGINGVVYGVLIGAFLHFLIQVPTLQTIGYRYQPIIDWRNPGLRRMLKLMLPRTVQLIMMQATLLAFARVAAQLPVGSVAGLNFADNIQTVPTVIFGNAFAMASFPYLSEAYADQEKGRFNHYLTRSTKAALFFLLPSAVGLYLLRIQIVRLILGSGHFGWDQTILTAEALGMFALGLVALGLIPLYMRAFFAMHDTKTPMYVTIPSSLVTIVIGYILAYRFNLGVGGLAAAASTGSIIQLIIMYSILRRRLHSKTERELWSSAATYLLLSLVMAAAIQLTKIFVGTTTDLRYGINVLLQGGAGLVIGTVVYLGLAILLRLEEVEFLWQKKKIFSKN